MWCHRTTQNPTYVSVATSHIFRAAECVFSKFFAKTYTRTILRDTSVPLLEVTIYISKRNSFFAFCYVLLISQRNTVFPFSRAHFPTASSWKRQNAFSPPAPPRDSSFSRRENRILNPLGTRTIYPRAFYKEHERRYIGRRARDFR